MRTKPKRTRLSWIRRRDAPRSNLQAGVLTGLAIAFVVALMTMMVIHHERFDRIRPDEWSSLPWDPAWPALPIARGGRELRADVAKAIYAFAGTKPEVMEYIPCYCGCRSRGHRSHHACYVKRRSSDGRVAEWNDHGLMCPLGPDISGDVILWHEQGQSLSVIRRKIDDEFGSRGPSTETPRPDSRSHDLPK